MIVVYQIAVVGPVWLKIKQSWPWLFTPRNTQVFRNVFHFPSSKSSLMIQAFSISGSTTSSQQNKAIAAINKK